MKTITFQGTEEQVKNLNFALDISSNSLPQKVETRVYVVDAGLTEEGITDEDYQFIDEFFMDEAERQGTVFTLDEFAYQFNGDKIKISNNTHYIRFINVPVY